MRVAFQLAKNVGNANFNEIMEADLSVQNGKKPEPSSDMWVLSGRTMTPSHTYGLSGLHVVFQADEEGLHHGQVHGEALHQAVQFWCHVKPAASVRGGQEQRRPVPDPGLLWGSGPDGDLSTAQRTCKTLLVWNFIVSTESVVWRMKADIMKIMKTYFSHKKDDTIITFLSRDVGITPVAVIVVHRLHT